MPGKKRNYSRRKFIKTAGAASLASTLMPLTFLIQAHGNSSTNMSEQIAVPTRPLGKTGVNVSTDKKDASMGDKQRLEQYAQQAAPAHCAGCAKICEKAVSRNIPISDIMRYLRYDNAYGNPELAVKCFKEIQPADRRWLLVTDFSKAEHQCPQNMPITQLMKKAFESFV